MLLGKCWAIKPLKNKKPFIIKRLQRVLVLGAGLEPARPYRHRILSPACLPIPPSERTSYLSGRRDSNSRPQPWQGCALPTELLSQYLQYTLSDPNPSADG